MLHLLYMWGGVSQRNITYNSQVLIIQCNLVNKTFKFRCDPLLSIASECVFGLVPFRKAVSVESLDTPNSSVCVCV